MEANARSNRTNTETTRAATTARIRIVSGSRWLQIPISVAMQAASSPAARDHGKRLDFNTTLPPNVRFTRQ